MSAILKPGGGECLRPGVGGGLRFLVLVPWLCACAGAPSAPASAPRPELHRARPPAPAVVRLTVTRPPPPALPRLELPPPPLFVDPVKLPDRSLKRSRILGYREKGLRRAWVHTHLAAQLWALANRELARVRRRDKLHPEWRESEARASRLRRISAHLKECVALLEGVLEVPRAPRLARIRLAYYLWRLNPSQALPHFAALVRSERDPTRRERYALDWAHLLLSLGRRARAAEVLTRYAATARSWRARLLRAFALREGEALAERALVSLVRGCAEIPAPLRRAFLNSLPRLLSGANRPEALLRGLLMSPCRAAARSRATLAGVVNALMVRGRLERAWALLHALADQALPGLPRLQERIGRRLHMGSSPRSRPPGAADWRRWLEARLQGWGRCGAQVLARIHGVVLGAQPSGRVRLVRVEGVSPPVRECLRRTVSGWRGMRWGTVGRSPVRLELRMAGGDAAR